MTTVAERLLESWLDSQGERRYQPAFIQMLVSDGWTVLHNTRHSPIEIGKDVIARNPAGELYCFQLKGNPGSRLTKSEASSLLAQYIELVELPPGPEFRTTADERHVAVFVTNGEIDEEARLVFNRASERAGKPGVAASRNEIWTRGDLLNKLMPAIKIWPTSLEGTRLILELFAGDGKALPDPVKVGTIIQSMIPAGKSVSSAAKTAALTSILLIAEVLKSRWYATSNHRALHEITTLIAVGTLPLADTDDRLALVKSYAELSLEHCRDLLTEAEEKHFDGERVWFQGTVLGEYDIQWERRRLVADCASILFLAKASLEPERRRYATGLVASVVRQAFLWGEGMIPSFIVAVWAMAKYDASLEPERRLAGVLASLLAAATSASALPGPYYTFTDCWARSEEFPEATDSNILGDSFEHRSTIAYSLFLLLARRNLKRTCGELWPRLSHLTHEDARIPDDAFFSPILCDDGETIARTLMTGVWPQLLDEATAPVPPAPMSRFKNLAWLVAAYVSIVPYRATTNVLMWLDEELAVTWYNASRRPLSLEQLLTEDQRSV